MQTLKSIYRFLSPRFQSVHLDYRVDPRPRYGHGLPAHPALLEAIEANRPQYRELLQGFAALAPRLQQIRPAGQESDPAQPAWNNGFLPGLDIVGIYGMISALKPRRYVEIGSGNSTKVARKAIADNNLATTITSIDPHPRADIDRLADEVVRRPFEQLPDYRAITDTLQEGDILFIDNSHRVFPNSDAAACFLDLLPYLRPGVAVHIHDIYLPYDYPQFMCDRFYNEQYTLAAFVLANPRRYQPLLPNYFISEDPELRAIVAPLWEHPNLAGVERHGGSFWLRVG